MIPTNEYRKSMIDPVLSGGTNFLRNHVQLSSARDDEHGAKNTRT
jgi:hypothetical protein